MYWLLDLLQVIGSFINKFLDLFGASLGLHDVPLLFSNFIRVPYDGADQLLRYPEPLSEVLLEHMILFK